MGQTSRKRGFAYGTCDRCGMFFKRTARSQPYKYCSLACAVTPLSERFFLKVDCSDSDGCWVWCGKKRKDGYGEVQHEKKIYKAHRLAMQFATGEPVPPEKEVCHTCDNPSCVRPSHLFIGTHSDNMKDMAEKGRGVYPSLQGEAHGAAKLTKDDVMAIISDRRSQRDIAAQYGITQSLVSQIKNSKIWTHLHENNTIPGAI